MFQNPFQRQAGYFKLIYLILHVWLSTYIFFSHRRLRGVSDHRSLAMICANWGQQHLQPPELHTAEDGSVSPGGGTRRVISTCSQSKHKVHMRMLDVC